MAGFTKLFSTIVDSSIWKQDSDICKVWVTLLALCDQDGFVRGAPGWLAYKCRIPMEKCQAALALFESPDHESRTPANDGRRIKTVPGGWLILNYPFYRNNLEVPENAGEPSNIGLVYYAVDGEDVKIGFSKNPWSRVNEMKTVRPSMNIVATERGTLSTERARHEQFSKYKKDREWFEYSPEIKEFVARLEASNKIVARRTTRTTTNDRSATPASASASVPKPVQVIPMAIPPKLHTAEFRLTWDKWVEFRKKKKHCKDWVAMFNQQLEWLAQYTPEQAIEVINRSIRNDWQGLFELPKETNAHKGSAPPRHDRNSSTLNNPANYASAAEKSQKKAGNLPGL